MPALDGIRGLAIALVLVHNLCGLDDDGNLVLRVFDTALTFGWVGVQLFFVLSGFLITGILVDDRGTKGYFRAFFMRRILRIFPLYYLVLLGYFVILPMLVRLPAAVSESLGNQVWYWLYLSNWAAPLEHGVKGLPHFWSLAVEEQFYLAWPLVVFYADTRRLVKVCIGLAVIAFAVRVGVRIAHLPPEIAYENTFARVDALAMGALGAVAVRDARFLGWLVPRLRMLWIGMGVATLAMVVITRGFARTNVGVQTVGYSLLAMFFTLLVVTGAVAPAFDDPGEGDGWMQSVYRGLASAPLRWLGKYSYGIYVFHIPLRIVGMRLIGGETVLTRGTTAHQLVHVLGFATVVAALSAMAAVLSWNVFEKRFLALKASFASGVPSSGR